MPEPGASYILFNKIEEKNEGESFQFKRKNMERDELLAVKRWRIDETL